MVGSGSTPGSGLPSGSAGPQGTPKFRGPGLCC